MPTLETPPNPAPLTPPETPDTPAPLRVNAGRRGEMDHTELVHLIDTLDDDRERARFRESVYISLFVYIAIAWFVLYGPRVLFHTPNVVPIKTESDHKHELTYLETPRDLQRVLPHTRTPTPRPDSPKPAPQPAARTPEPPKPAPRPTPQPRQPALPNAPQPVQQQPTPQPRPTPPTPTPQPRPTLAAAIPDAPRPTAPSTRPSFAQPSQSLADIAKNAIPGRGGSGNIGSDSPGRPGLSSGAEILSDTEGVDFDPYIKRIVAMIRAGWIPLIPEETRAPLNKEGQTLIRFTIGRDGTLQAMHLDASTHDNAINEAAWGGIKSVGQYPPLPAAFKGPNLELRIQFIITNSAHGRNSAQ